MNLLTTDLDGPGSAWSSAPTARAASRQHRRSRTALDIPDLATDQKAAPRGVGEHADSYRLHARHRRSQGASQTPRRWSAKPSAQPTLVRTQHLPPGKTPGHWPTRSGLHAQFAYRRRPVARRMRGEVSGAHARTPAVR